MSMNILDISWKCDLDLPQQLNTVIYLPPLGTLNLSYIEFHHQYIVSKYETSNWGKSEQRQEKFGAILNISVFKDRTLGFSGMVYYDILKHFRVKNFDLLNKNF